MKPLYLVLWSNRPTIAHRRLIWNWDDVSDSEAPIEEPGRAYNDSLSAVTVCRIRATVHKPSCSSAIAVTRPMAAGGDGTGTVV